MVSRVKRILSLVLTLALVLPALSPVVAWAAETEVEVENHTISQGQKEVSGLTIDEVDEPKAGEPLDDKAVVRTAEEDTWEIPVLWVSDDLELSTQAEEGSTYLPALAFFVPQDYALAGDNVTVTLSESLTKLFAGKEVISVYDAETGITYILPASLRYFFVASQDQNSAGEVAYETSAAEEANTGDRRSLVDIYCAQTARDALSDDDLEYLLDLVLTKLQPQAVELLLEKFPAFREAADQGQIGREIGLYIYYEKGDDDGKPEHQIDAPNALAYVFGDAFKDGDDVKYGYMIAIDVESLVQKDEDGNPVRDSRTGKYVLLRDGDAMRTFENTMVHELFHALMDDYNRTGMVGATDIRNAVTNDDGSFPTKELEDLYNKIHYPRWFIEGTASSVENDYAFRHDIFQLLRADPSLEGGYDNESGAFGRRLLANYVSGTNDGKDAYFDLGFAGDRDADGNEVDGDNSRYVSGYLAVLYLGELAARQTQGSSVSTDNDRLYISSETIRMGLNDILERMHNGETLDEVINSISPTDENGKKLYTNTDEFEDKFIKGVGLEKEGEGTIYLGDLGDSASYAFVSTFLDYMLELERQEGRQYVPTGSILFDFEEDYNTPLDNEKESTSDLLHIVESNELVESTVPNEVALAGGGKSEGQEPMMTSDDLDEAVGYVAAAEECQTTADAEASGEAETAVEEVVQEDTYSAVVDTEQGYEAQPTAEDVVQDEAVPEVEAVPDSADEPEVLDDAA